MTSFYLPSAKDEKGHVCDMCEIPDGRPTLYFKDKDFDICHDCISSLYFDYVSKYDKKNESVSVKRMIIKEELRNRILDRDGNKCVLCGSDKKLEIDHVLPFSKGGKTDESNLQTLCKKCNIKKRAL